jgi:Na+/phosphate symporter
MVIGLDALVGLVGLLIFAFSTHAKLPEIGRIMFFCGLFAFLMQGERIVALFK